MSILTGRPNNSWGKEKKKQNCPWLTKGGSKNPFTTAQTISANLIKLVNINKGETKSS